jgi:hypothetical protein
MKKQHILAFLVLFLLIKTAYCETINLNYPLNVNAGEEFNINLQLNNFSENNYDIKIDIFNSNDSSQRLSKIFNNGEWKSTNYYVDNSINISEKNNENFILNITENYEGIANMSIKVRKSGSSTVQSYNGYYINISSFKSNSENDYDALETAKSSINASIYLEAESENEEIINGNEFYILVKAYNLENKSYDLRTWIQSPDNMIISDRYEDIWQSGIYFINGFFEGPGNKSGDVKLKIRDNYLNFSGNAILFVKLRDSIQIVKSIEIIKKNDSEEETNINSSEEIKNNKIQVNNADKENSVNEVIYLNQESDKNKEIVIYESISEKMKKYSVYGFAGLCLILCILIIMKKLK